ncbi:hypothetical protein HYS92_03205 [Candidatus Daviesbacteria bacterium]|nr:hypothetical protein [Candidatus Daviesbacteria bacterium]
MSFLKSFNFWLVISIILLVGFFAFIIGRYTALQNRTIPKQVGNTNNLFTSQTATIRGYIKGVSNNKIRIENTAGIDGEVETADNLIIKQANNSGTGPSSDLKSLRFNEEVLVILELAGDKYKVATITYVPFLPKLP